MAKHFGKKEENTGSEPEASAALVNEPESPPVAASEAPDAEAKPEQAKAPAGRVMTEVEARKMASERGAGTINRTIPTTQVFAPLKGAHPEGAIVIARYSRKNSGPLGRAQKLAQLLTDFGWAVGIATDGETDTLWGYQPL